MTNEKKEQSINLHVPESIANGDYANIVLCNYSKEEFVFDYAFLQPHVNKTTVTNRIVMSPGNAKKLAAILAKNIQEYEKKAGPINNDPPQNGIKFSIN